MKNNTTKKYQSLLPVVSLTQQTLPTHWDLAQMVFKLQAVLLQQKNATHQMHISKPTYMPEKRIFK